MRRNAALLSSLGLFLRFVFESSSAGGGRLASSGGTLAVSGTFGETNPFGDVARVSILGGTLLFLKVAAPMAAQSSSSVSE